MQSPERVLDHPQADSHTIESLKECSSASDEQAFVSLAETFGRVRQQCSSLAVLAIPWMYLKHPIHPTQQWLLNVWREQGRSDTQVFSSHRQTVLGWLRQLVRCVGYATYLSIIILGIRLLLYRKLKALRHRHFDIIAKTWCVDRNPPEAGKDFYYGDLQQQLVQSARSLLILCGDSTNDQWRAFASRHTITGAMARLSEWSLLHPLKPWQMVVKQLLASRRLRRLARRTDDPFMSLVCERACWDCLTPEVTETGLFFWIGRTSMLRWHPRTWLILYEGHAWEQCLWHGIRASGKPCTLTGYHHTVLMLHNRELLQQPSSDDTKLRPDIILCTGNRTQAMLQQSHPDSLVISFGSFRRRLERPIRKPQPALRSILVLPEGIASEARLLFDTGLCLARLLSDYQFYFRCHPVLPFEQVGSLLHDRVDRYSNVQVSTKQTIEEDFQRSSIVLYRGSSAVLYAILYGLKPIYWHDRVYSDVDPLFEMTLWRERASSPQVAAEFLRRYSGLSPEQVIEHWQAATAYVEQYTHPVTPASIERWLTVLGTNPNGQHL